MEYLLNNAQLITKTADVFKDKIISLFNTNIPKQTVYGRRKKLSKPKAKKIRRKQNK